MKMMIEFPVPSSAGGESPWVNRLEKWARTALDDSLNLESRADALKRINPGHALADD